MDAQTHLAPTLEDKDARLAALAHAVLREVFDERDAGRRTAAIERVFAADARFIDHFGTHVGRAAIGEAVERLHARLPGYRIAPGGAPELLDGAARVAWRFGPPSEPARITGTDTILAEDGRVSVLLVFLDRAPGDGD